MAINGLKDANLKKFSVPLYWIPEYQDDALINVKQKLAKLKQTNLVFEIKETLSGYFTNC